MNNNIVDSSFRDPSGFLFIKDRKLYRQINKSYKEDYELFVSSGLYKRLIDDDLLIKHEEVNIRPEDKDAFCCVISGFRRHPNRKAEQPVADHCTRQQFSNAAVHL